jgi:hypothetical protein
MNTPSAVSTSLGCLLLCAGAFGALPGCSDTAPFPDTDDPGLTDRPTPAPAGLVDGAVVVSEYVLQVRPGQKTAKLLRLKPGTSSRPGFNPQSVDNLTIEQDGTAGVGSANTVELNTTTVTYGATCPSGLAASFCAHVILGSFYPRTLNNTFVQVTAITDTNGAPLSGHGSINSDGPPSWLADAGLGLWKHTGAGATNAGVVGTTATSKFAPRDWEFADPDGQDTNIALRVISTLSYGDYTQTSSPQAFINACLLSGFAAPSPATGFTQATIPFPFTFYTTQATTTLRYSRDAVVTFDTGVPPSAANAPFMNVNLPENPAVISTTPGLYVFWDQLNYNSATSTVGKSSTCYATSGAAPNRQFVITWRNLRGFNDNTDTMNLTFSAILSEGTDTIDLTYGSMLGTSANDPNVYPSTPTVSYARRSAGKKAVVGVQGEGIASPFPAVRGGLDTSTGKAYRFTPRP